MSRDLDVWAALAMSFEAFCATEPTVPKRAEARGLSQDALTVADEFLAEVYRLRAEAGDKRSPRGVKVRSAILDAMLRADAKARAKYDKFVSCPDTGRRRIIGSDGSVCEEYLTFLVVDEAMSRYPDGRIRAWALQVRPGKGRWSGPGSDPGIWLEWRQLGRQRREVRAFLDWWASQEPENGATGSN